jgi:hypothetical protein
VTFTGVHHGAEPAVRAEFPVAAGNLARDSQVEILSKAAGEFCLQGAAMFSAKLTTQLSASHPIDTNLRFIA